MSKFWKMHDDFVEWEWWNYYPHHPLFEWLLTKAMMRDKKVHGILVRRGSVLTTWSEMQAAVSNKHHQCSRGSLARALNDLKLSGDLTLKTDCRQTIVTICKYESYCGRDETLWTDNGLIADRQRTDTPIINKNREYENNIYSAREGFDPDDGFVTESDCRHWMRRYAEIARCFGVAEKDLPQQLTASRIQKIVLCVRQRGRGSVDAMFARLAESSGYFDQGSRGFRGDFTNLWSPSIFDKVLEGSFVPVSKRKEARQEEPKKVGTIEVGPQQPSPRSQEERKRTLLELVEYVTTNPRGVVGCGALEEAYRTGELARYGIDWKPNK